MKRRPHASRFRSRTSRLGTHPRCRDTPCDGDGSDAGSFALSPADGIPLTWRIRPEDGFLIEEVRTLPSARRGEARNLLIVRDSDGEIRDTLIEVPVGGAMVIQNGLPQVTMFAPEPLWTMLTDGCVASGQNSEYRIEVRTTNGRLERVVRRAFERSPVPHVRRRHGSG